ncbi:MAG: ATPase, T2SS/T4P/T4SS family [Planctomycetota bacterium]
MLNITTIPIEPDREQPDATPLDRARVKTPDPEIMHQRVAMTLGLRFEQDLRGLTPSARFMERVPIGYARDHKLMGFAGDAGQITLVVQDAMRRDVIDIVTRHLASDITLSVAPGSAILTAINTAYQQRSGQADALIESLDRQTVLEDLKAIPTHEDLLDVDTRAPVIKLVNLMLFDAVQQNASDVHVQPYESRTMVRMRIDGVLFDAFELPHGLREEVVSRIKVMGRMNIAEKRLPQDGRASVQVGDRAVDLRIASMPTSHGERAVIRLLDKGAQLYTLDELGMPGDVLPRYRDLISIEHGLALVTGPTGSGKTTTLYAALQEINAAERNILTLEDPIEYQLSGISQSQISAKKGMTFASGLRSVLRQDPDIIMVGEIRDHETAVMAIQSALTGHLVFSTLHTNDAASALTRLLDLGIEPYLVASSLVGVMAQRLVRRVCRACGKPLDPTQRDRLRNELVSSGFSAEVSLDNALYGAGCDSCRGTGYRGRCGVFELLGIEDELREAIQERATAARIKRSAMAGGMRTLRQDGLDKTLRGITTLDEVNRVTMRLGG